MNEKFETWAIVELMGHAKIAGMISEQPLAGTAFLRVDVPETPTIPAFTRFLGGSAIYAINPCTEEIAKYMTDKIQAKPVEVWDVREFISKNRQLADRNGKEEGYDN